MILFILTHQSFAMADKGKLELAGSFKSSHSSASTIDKYDSTISMVTNSNLEGSYNPTERKTRKKETKDEN
jgi:hypothetical protein